jgi:hypothetical protein
MGDKEWFMRGEVDAGAPHGGREPGSWRLLAGAPGWPHCLPGEEAVPAPAAPHLTSCSVLALHLLPCFLQAAAPRIQHWRLTSTLTQPSNRLRRWAPATSIGHSVQVQPGPRPEKPQLPLPAAGQMQWRIIFSRYCSPCLHHCLRCSPLRR